MSQFTAYAVTLCCGAILATAPLCYAQQTPATPVITPTAAEPVTNQPTSTAAAVSTEHQPLIHDDSALEHVLVSVPIHRQLSATALPITLLSGEELRALATSTIGDTLANKPGLANASFGPAVGQPVVRGQQGPRVSVLQNSIQSADASNVSADHAVSIEPLLADSVEVLRGPATLLYGGGAIGGVVNVIDNRIPTRRLDETTGGVEYRHDGASDLDVSVFRLDSGNGDFAFHIDGLYRDWNDLDIPGYAIDEAALDSLHQGHAHAAGDEERDNTKGYVENTGGRSKSITAGGSVFFDGGLFGLSVSRLENRYGIPPAGHAHHKEHEEHDHGDHDDHDADSHAGGVTIDLEQTRYDSRLQLDDPLTGVHSLQWLLSYTDYQHQELESSGTVGSVFKNNSWQSRLEITHEPVLGWHGVVGLQWREGDFSATGEESFIPKTNTRSAGVFVVEGFDRGDWTYELGLRLDQDQLKPDSVVASDKTFNSASLSASALWQITEQWQAAVALSHAERAPVTEELFSNVDVAVGDEYIVHGATQSIEIGNPNLDTEQSSNVDIKLAWQGERARVDATAFYNDFSDYIYLQSTGLEQDELPVLAYQQQDARFSGVEMEAELSLLEFSKGQLTLSVFGDSIRGVFDRGGDVPRLPPYRLGSKLNYSSGNWSSFISVIDAAKQDRPSAHETETAGYTRWDLGLDYRMPGLAANDSLLLFVKANNITDEDIRLSSSFLRNYAPEAGRSLMAGLRYSF